ncbi:hypothetical protein E4T91_09780, partial [Ligilactobacillus murinus]
TVRSKKKVNRQMGIALMALNMWKMSTSSSKISPNNKNKKKTIRIFQNFQKIRMVFFKDRDLCHSLFLHKTIINLWRSKIIDSYGRNNSVLIILSFK